MNLCGDAGWGPLRPDNSGFTPCFQEIVLHGSIPLVYLIVVFLVYKRVYRKTENYTLLPEADTGAYSPYDDVMPSDSYSRARSASVSSYFIFQQVNAKKTVWRWALILFSMFATIMQGVSSVFLALSSEFTFSSPLFIGNVLGAVSSAFVVIALLRMPPSRIFPLIPYYFLLLCISLLRYRTSVRFPPSNNPWLLYVPLALLVVSVLSFAAASMDYLKLVNKKHKLLTARKVNGLTPSLEKHASWLELAIFGWFTPMVVQGYTKSLEMDDVWDLMADDKAKAACKAYEKNRHRPRLVPKMFHTIKWLLLGQILCGTAGAIAAFGGPFFLNKILTFIEKPTSLPDWLPPVYIIGLLFGGVFQSICNGRTYFLGRRIGARLRAILISETYEKTLRRKATQPSAQDSNEKSKKVDVNVLISTDIQKILDYVCYLQYLITTPLQIAICITSLYYILGFSALSGVALMVLMMPIQSWAGTKMANLQEDVMNATDARVTKMNELLQGVRIIKFFAWENKFHELLSEKRGKEIKRLKSYLHAVAVVSVLYHSVPILVSLLTFMSYTKIAQQDLDATKVFTSLSLFYTLRMPLFDLPDQIVRFMETRVSVERVATYLREPEITRYQLDREEIVDSKELVSYTSFEEPRMSYGTFVKPSLTSSLPTDPSQIPTVGFWHASFEWESPDNDESTSTDNPSHTTSTYSDSTLDNSDEDTPLMFSDEKMKSSTMLSPQPKFSLSDLTVNFPTGGLTVIIGSTGAGKTSMLMALLGEMSLTNGAVFIPKTEPHKVDSKTGLYKGVCYVPQQAWLQNATIKDNIVFGAPVVEDRYQKTLYDCALTRDLEILEGGDLTEIGEKGINLSGGQKQRISLARACYNKASTVILDDVLSAVDAPTARHLFEHCILDSMANRTRILVTHNAGLCAQRADLILVVKDGCVVAQGNNVESVKAELERKGCDELVLFEGGTEDESTFTNRKEKNKKKKDEKKSDAVAEDKKGTKLVQEEEKAVGNVDWSVYLTYIKSSGGWPYWLVLIGGIIVSQLLAVGQDYWLKTWAAAYTTIAGNSTTPGQDAMDSVLNSESLFLSSNFTGSLISALSLTTLSTFGQSFSTFALSAYPNSIVNVYSDSSTQDGVPAATPEPEPIQSSYVNVNFYLGIYILIGCLNMLFQYIFTLAEFFVSLKASKNLHDRLLDRILHAPISFFDKTPIGRIMNRFSRDIQAIDREVAGGIMFFLFNVAGVISVIALVALVTPLFILPMIPIGFMYKWVANYYLYTSRELKRLDSTTRSPIYSIFSETATGTTVIRAFGAEKRFVDENYKRVDTNHRAFFYLWVSNRWLAIRTDCLGAFVVFFCGLAILIGMGSIDAGLAGLALSYCLTFTDSVMWLVRMHAQMEMNMNSVERFQEFVNIEQEAPAVIEGSRPPKSWPDKGKIRVRDLVVHYSPDLPAVLRGVSFTVYPKEKIGIVGRTGAGKSSLAVSFFRFMEATSGSISIDDINISRIGLQDLRSRITIIPQDPVLFEGTIRSNLDVFNEYTDFELFNTLRRVHLLSGSVDDLHNMAASMASLASVASVSNNLTNLESLVTEGGTNYSVGQRQLLALARALLRRSKVIIMDEATANISNDLDSKIQETIRSEFSDSTILCIAHRLRTVIDFDRILVLDHGEVKEYDTPLNLLQNPDGIFYNMCQESGEFDYLFDIARNKSATRNTSSYQMRFGRIMLAPEE